jgi:hypothetical protein
MPEKPERLTFSAPVKAVVNGREQFVRTGSDGKTYDMKGNALDAEVLPPVERAPAGPQSPVAVMGPDGRPVYVRPGDAIGRTPASSREQGRPVQSGDADKLAELATSLDDVAVLRTALKGTSATGARAQAGAALPNFVTEAFGWGGDAKQKQAVIDRVKQVIGKALEGGVLRKEDEAKYARILPTIGDPTDVAVTKLNGLEKALKQRRERTLESLDDSGFDTSRFKARQPATADPLGIR